MKMKLSALLLAVVILTISAAPAMAVTGREYGEHIREHAWQQHFSGEDNPGNHRGFSGFEDHHPH